MAYKARFPALERLSDGRWVPFVQGYHEDTEYTKG